jgi:hypothetical protein
MKKILLSLMFVSTFILVKAQNVVLNEIYGNPGGSNSEFIELYNSLNSGSMDCYTIMTYYENEGGSAQGWYVLDLPNTPAINSAPGFYVLSSTTPFSVQGTSGATADVNWNALSFRNGSTNGYLKKYEWNGSGYTDLLLPNTTIVNNLLDGTLNGSQIYITLLFRNGVLINGFFGGASTGKLSDLAVSLGSLTVPQVGCGLLNNQFTVNFSTLRSVEFFNPSGGNDNGYARSSDGKCGAWVKTAPQVNHSPGISNGSASNLLGSLTVANVIRCGEFNGDTAPRVDFNVTGFTGDVNFTDDFPIEVYLFYDNGSIPGELDGNDEAHVTNFKTITDTAVSTVDTFHFKEGYGITDIILLYKTQRGCYDRVVALTNPCSALPVSLMSFTAARNRSIVELDWQTAMEDNSRGFDVQRKIGSGAWVSVGFVQSKSVNGNSNSPLSYEFTDLNATKGITQYRLRQLDYDGKSAYSFIRSVRGDGQKGKTIVYPNPSSDGKVNVVFEDAKGIRDVSVNDMSGRVIKQMRGVTNNNITIDNLSAGFYTVRIVNNETGEQTVEKFVVNKR